MKLGTSVAFYVLPVLMSARVFVKLLADYSSINIPS